MPPQQQAASPDSFTHSRPRSKLIPPHSSQSTSSSMHKLEQDWVSATLHSSWTHKPTWTLESFIPQQEQQPPPPPQQQQQQQRPLHRNDGFGTINTTSYYGDSYYNEYSHYYDSYYYNVYPHYYDSYSYNEYPDYHYHSAAAATQMPTPASTATQTTTPDTTTTTEPMTPRSFAPSLESSPSYYHLFPKDQLQSWGQAIEYHTACSRNLPHSFHTTKETVGYPSLLSSREYGLVDQTIFLQEQRQPRVYGIQGNNNHSCKTAKTTTPHSSAEFSSLIYESAYYQQVYASRGQDSRNQTALGHSRHLETTDRTWNQANPESHNSRWTSENPILDSPRHQSREHGAVYKTTLGHNYYPTPETTPPCSPKGTYKSHSSAYQSIAYSQQTHASQGYESEYKTAFSNELHHHAAMNQIGYHAYPESHEPQWTYTSHFVQQQPPYGNGTELDTSLNSCHYRSTLNPSENRSLNTSHEANITHQGGFSQQQQQQQTQLDRRREHVMALGYNHGNSATMNSVEYRLFPSMGDSILAQRGCFTQPHMQQTQGHKDDSRVVDNSSNHHHYDHIAVNFTVHKPVPGSPLPLPPPPAAAAAAAASQTHNSGGISLILTKAFSPYYSDSDDWLEQLLEEVPTDPEDYPTVFGSFVAYERYRTQLEKAEYQRKQKIEAKVRAITKAKADGQAKYQAKAQNKIKNTIMEVLFSRL
ncbi:hypothetical protein BKA57DRAFT_528555 [Linnemannia elongata]|nr:hypothetical protein BKA57DRAFT_528555 [Linnemannia elongata]